MIRCKKCSRLMRAVTNSHLKMHGLTTIEYKKQFGGPMFCEDSLKKHRKYNREELVNLGLGKDPDAKVAQKAGIETEAVKGVRKSMGIPSPNGLLITQEGFPCRSIYEAKYDAWLHWQGTKHEHEVKIPGLPYIADFRLECGTYVEILGMMGYVPYVQKTFRKHRDYDKHCIPCNWIESTSVDFICRDCPLPIRYQRIRRCSKCKTEEQDLVNGMCRPCNHADWNARNATIMKCGECGKDFPRLAGSKDAKYCSYPCYWKSLLVKNPSKGTLYMRERRAKQRENK